MTRQTCVDALTDTFAGMPEFSPDSQGTVVSYDDRAAASGVDRAVVVRHVRGEEQPRFFSWDWYLAAQLWVRVNNRPAVARATASALVDAMLAKLRVDPRLADRVTEAVPTETRTVHEQQRFSNGVFYVEDVLVRVREVV